MIQPVVLDGDGAAGEAEHPSSLLRTGVRFKMAVPTYSGSSVARQETVSLVPEIEREAFEHSGRLHLPEAYERLHANILTHVDPATKLDKLANCSRSHLLEHLMQFEVIHER